MDDFLDNGDPDNDDDDSVNLSDDPNVSVDEPEEAEDVDKGSFIDRYLGEIQTELTRKRGEWPKCYKEGTLWYESKLPSFALRKQLSPEELYKPRVCIWLPHLLALSSLKCPKCNEDLSADGYTKDPKARRIIDFDE